MPRVKNTARRPVTRERLAGLTITVQRCRRSKYTAVAVMRREGKRLRERYFTTLEAAESEAQAWGIEASNTGAVTAASLTDIEKRFLVEARESLAPFGKTLRDALAFYLAHLNSQHSSRPLLEAIDALLLHRQKKGKSSRYQDDLRVKLARLETYFTGRTIAEIGRDELEKWLDTLGGAPVTYNNFRRVLHVLWAFAKNKHWVRENIVSQIEPQTVRAERPGVLTLAQARALLNKADDSILPYLSMALFGGLRDAELKRLDWRAVEFPTGYIRISATVSKTGRERLVPIPENLKAWLTPVAKSRGKVTPNNWRALLLKARNEAAIIEWPHDATRHSFGTYEMARTKDIGHVSEVMGNSPAIVQRHYKAAVPFEHGAEYFGIFPSQESNVIAFSRTA